MKKRIIIATDSFKGSLSSTEVAESVKEDAQDMAAESKV